MAGKQKNLGKGMEKLILYQRHDALQTAARKGGRERHAPLGSARQSQHKAQPCSSSVERSQGSARGSSGEEEDCTQGLALVYSSVVPHCPQMLAGWKVPDVASCQQRLSKWLRDAGSPLSSLDPRRTPAHVMAFEPIFSGRTQQRIHQTDELRLGVLLHPHQLETEKGAHKSQQSRRQRSPLPSWKHGDKTKTRIRYDLPFRIITWQKGFYRAPSCRQLPHQSISQHLSWKRCCQGCDQHQQEEQSRRAALASPGPAGLSQALVAPSFYSTATAKSARA